MSKDLTSILVVIIVVVSFIAIIWGTTEMEKNICIKNGGTPIVSYQNGVSCIYESEEK